MGNRRELTSNIPLQLTSSNVLVHSQQKLVEGGDSSKRIVRSSTCSPSTTSNRSSVKKDLKKSQTDCGQRKLIGPLWLSKTSGTVLVEHDLDLTSGKIKPHHSPLPSKAGERKKRT